MTQYELTIDDEMLHGLFQKGVCQVVVGGIAIHPMYSISFRFMLGG